MKATPLQSAHRQWRAAWRDTSLLLREFRKPLLLFVLLILGSGFLYHALASRAGEPLESYAAAFYQVLSLIFLQSITAFPHTLSLQLFYFILPILGLSCLAQGLADFGIMFFNRRARSKEWEMAVASTFSNHVILVGLGHLGFRVVRELHTLGQDVVVIELEPKEDLLRAVRELAIPVIHDDASRQSALEAAGVRNARAILLCTQNDSLNLQIALKARSLQPTMQVVIRIFDNDFAQELHDQFGFHALSATGMAAPIFAASVAGVDITPPVDIDGQANSLARFQVQSTSPLIGKAVNKIEDTFSLSVVLLIRGSQKHHHPEGSLQVQADDTLVVLGAPETINRLIYDNH